MCKTNEDTRYVTACSSGCPLRFRNSTRHLFSCRERLRARSYRLRFAVVFVHAFGFELIAGGFEASLGFARLCSSSHVFEGLSAFRSADALRFGYHIPATAPNPQTRFALAHRASQSHGPFKRHEESYSRSGNLVSDRDANVCAAGEFSEVRHGVHSHCDEEHRSP